MSNLSVVVLERDIEMENEDLKNQISILKDIKRDLENEIDFLRNEERLSEGE